MKINRIFFSLAIAFGLVFSACDIVDEPLDPERPPVTDGKKVLVEDFTGHQCGNCPRAHESAHDLQDAYGDAVVVVGIHVGGFAEVDSAKGYYNDFNTAYGELMDDEYDVDNFGLPVGMVSRRALSGEQRQRHGNWSTIAADILSEPPVLSITPTVTYDGATRVVEVTTKLEYFLAGTDKHSIVALITEDSVVSKQSDYSLIPDYIDPYYQMHVLRTSMTPGIFGEIVKGNTIFIGERITKTFTTTLDQDWRAEHCHVVVFVVDQDNGEVLQVEDVYINPQ